jgi:F0F1-type ATP synthase delta subunit
MKIDKKLQKLIDGMVKSSLTIRGDIDNPKVKRFISSLSKLPKQNAIFALTDYSKKLKRAVDKVTLEIESATKLSILEQKRIVNAFKADYHIHIVKVKINKKLIGGIRVKIGDRVFEDSIISKINQVKESITSN